jgi:hypothetical protein
MTTTLAYTTSTPTAASRRIGAIARVLNAPRTPSRSLQDEGQLLSDELDWCFICSRATDHSGEHTPEQIAAWKAGMLLGPAGESYYSDEVEERERMAEALSDLPEELLYY